MALTAQELRIGNWVQLVGDHWRKKHRDTFVPLDLDDFCSITKGSKDFGAIPLTEEWMVKFGFDPTNNYGGIGFKKGNFILYKVKRTLISSE